MLKSCLFSHYLLILVLINLSSIFFNPLCFRLDTKTNDPTDKRLLPIPTATGVPSLPADPPLSPAKKQRQETAKRGHKSRASFPPAQVREHSDKTGFVPARVERGQSGGVGGSAQDYGRVEGVGGGRHQGSRRPAEWRRSGRVVNCF